MRKSRNMARVMKGKRVKIYAVNSHTLKNKIDSLRYVACRRDLDFIMVSEAGLEKRKKNYKATLPLEQTTKSVQEDQ